MNPSLTGNDVHPTSSAWSLLLPVIGSALLAAVVIIATTRWHKSRKSHGQSGFGTVAAELAANDRSRRRASLAARVCALLSLAPVCATLGLRTASIVQQALSYLGLTVAAGILLAVVRVAMKIPLRSMWNPDLGYPRLAGLALLGAAGSSFIPFLWFVVHDPRIMKELVTRLFAH
jgi:hypothetical protein